MIQETRVTLTELGIIFGEFLAATCHDLSKFKIEDVELEENIGQIKSYQTEALRLWWGHSDSRKLKIVKSDIPWLSYLTTPSSGPPFSIRTHSSQFSLIFSTLQYPHIN